MDNGLLYGCPSRSYNSPPKRYFYILFYSCLMTSHVCRIYIFIFFYYNVKYTNSYSRYYIVGLFIDVLSELISY